MTVTQNLGGGGDTEAASDGTDTGGNEREDRGNEAADRDAGGRGEARAAICRNSTLFSRRSTCQYTHGGQARTVRDGPRRPVQA